MHKLYWSSELASNLTKQPLKALQYILKILEYQYRGLLHSHIIWVEYLNITETDRDVSRRGIVWARTNQGIFSSTWKYSDLRLDGHGDSCFMFSLEKETTEIGVALDSKGSWYGECLCQWECGAGKSTNCKSQVWV